MTKKICKGHWLEEHRNEEAFKTWIPRKGSFAYKALTIIKEYPGLCRQEIMNMIFPDEFPTKEYWNVEKRGQHCTSWAKIFRHKYINSYVSNPADLRIKGYYITKAGEMALKSAI